MKHNLKKKFKPNLDNLKSQNKKEETSLNLLENILDNNDTDNESYTNILTKSNNNISKVKSENNFNSSKLNQINNDNNDTNLNKIKSEVKVIKNPFEYKKKKVNLFSEFENDEDDDIFSNKQNEKNIFEE